MNSFCVGKLVEYDLSAMIHMSSVIVIGKVIDLQEVGNVPHYRSGKAKIKIDQIIKGNYDYRQITVEYYPFFADSAAFQLGVQYILFLKEENNANYYTVVQGYAG